VRLPDILGSVINTSELSLEESVHKVLDLLLQRGIIKCL